MLTSSPINNDQKNATVPREYNELPDLRFNYQADNKISVGTICRGVDVGNSPCSMSFVTPTFLLGLSVQFLSTFQGQQTARHIIIVAASTPSDDIDDTDLGAVAQNGRTRWHLLAQKLAQVTA